MSQISTTGTGKYRGSPVYLRVYAELIAAAQYRGVTTYQDVAVMMGLPITGHHMASEVAVLLREICEDELTAGRPMLSSVVIGVGGEVGEGFYALARRLGRLTTDMNQADFATREREATYMIWRRRLP